MSGRLEGKVAVVTGGGNGIGRATVLRFLAEGARVVVAEINQESGRETLDLASRGGAKNDVVRLIRADVSSEADVAAAVDLAKRDFGRLDCVFNNAGIAGAFGPIDQIEVAEWDYTFSVLVRGVFLGIKHATRVLKAQGEGGAIINTASIAGMSGGDGPQAYSSSKAAVINLTRAVAVELAPERIRVNAICPGAILTPLIHRGNPELMRERLRLYQPWPEVGQPEHIASVALFLASDDAAFVTGEALVADGGAMARGGNALDRLGGGELLRVAAGVDRGSTGQESTARALE